MWMGEEREFRGYRWTRGEWVCMCVFFCFFFCFFNDPATTEIYTLSLHDALPIFSNGFYDFFGRWIYQWFECRRIGHVHLF